MNNIDIIYYSATSTDILGDETVIQAQYFVPFFDFLLVFLVFSFTVLIIWFTHFLLYPRKQVFKIKNYLSVKRR
jgi:Na+/phosphate symporter